MRFPAKKNAICPKAPRDFPPIKDGILYRRRVVLGLPSPSHIACVDGRTYGCTDVRTDGHVTITSEPQFLGLIVYQISLAMELRWWALPTGSAIISQKSHCFLFKLKLIYKHYMYSTYLTTVITRNFTLTSNQYR